MGVMRVVILADDSFARREQGMLARLELGLADEGERVVHAVPERVLSATGQRLFSQAVGYRDSGLALSRAMRASRLLHDVSAQLGVAQAVQIDVVHVFGVRAWALGLDLAAQAQAELVLELSSPANEGDMHVIREASEASVGPSLFVPDSAMERWARKVAPGIDVRVTPWGVHCPTRARSILPPGRRVAVMAGGSGTDAGATRAAIEGLARVAQENAEVMIFLDAEAARASASWAVCRRVGVLDRVSLIPEFEARRELVLRGDLLVLPDSRGEHRSIILDAMAVGMAVVAARDDLVEWFVDGRTALLVSKADAGLWSAVVSSLLREPDRARTLGQSAHAFVRERHKVSAHVASVLDGYHSAQRRTSIPFDEAARGPDPA